MRALSEVSSDIADIGRQLCCRRVVGCIIQNEDRDWFYLWLVFRLFNTNSRSRTTQQIFIQRNCSKISMPRLFNAYLKAWL